MKKYYIVHYNTNALCWLKGADAKMLNLNGVTPIYIQIAEWMENQILNGTFQIDEKVHSQYTLAEMFNINPATAAKGLHLLSEEEILYTKRGLGKFVSPLAKTIIMEKRKSQTLTGLITDLVLEAKQLQVEDDELLEMIRKEMKQQKGEEI